MLQILVKMVSILSTIPYLLDSPELRYQFAYIHRRNEFKKNSLTTLMR